MREFVFINYMIQMREFIPFVDVLSITTELRSLRGKKTNSAGVSHFVSGIKWEMMPKSSSNRTSNEHNILTWTDIHFSSDGYIHLIARHYSWSAADITR